MRDIWSSAQVGRVYGARDGRHTNVYHALNKIKRLKGVISFSKLHCLKSRLVSASDPDPLDSQYFG